MSIINSTSEVRSILYEDARFDSYSPLTEELLDLAREDSVIIRMPDGKVFYIVELDGIHNDGDDFAEEIARTRRNKALMTLLAERSKEPGKYTLAKVRELLGLDYS
jgi:hypothetical protein